MAFNRNAVNLGNQFSHAAAVSRGDASENTTRSRCYFHLPNGIKGHKWGANEERFNILLAKNNATDPDDTGYKFYKAVPIHELPNLADPKHPHQYPCPRIIGKPCPCCERKEELDDGSKGGENWDRIKPFLPKDRVLYYFNPEGTSDILLHECAAKQKGEAAFPQRLMAQATAMSEGSLPLPFASPTTDGKIVKVNTAKDNYNGSQFYNASAVNFFDRKELPADELYDRCVPWNELLNFGSYEEMQRVMNGGEPDPYIRANNANAQANQPAAQQYTEQQKQDEFERACEESLRNNQQTARDQQMTGDALNRWNKAHETQAPASPANFTPAPAAQPTTPAGFTTSPASEPLSEADFNRDPYAAAPKRDFPSEKAQPAPACNGCPHGLRFGMDFENSRRCCNCAAHDACGVANKNG